MRANRVYRHSLLCAAIAAGIAAMLLWLGPPGADLAAHVYQRGLLLQHGFVFWNNFWYAGRYSFVTYSLLYYPLAALLGIKLLALASVAVATAAFSVVAEREWGSAARWSARAFALASAASVVSAAFPYALGTALALVALAVLQARRHFVFALLVGLTLAASPLAFALLVVVLIGVGAAKSRRELTRPGLAVAAVGAVAVVLWRVFPDPGRFPFSFAELAAALTFCVLGLALTWRVARARVLRSIYGVYLAACVLAFAVPSGLGENVARLRFVAIPIAALTLSLRRWRPLPVALGAFALALCWNATPLAYSFVRDGRDPSADPVYWQPAVRYLRRELGHSYRVEAVDTTGHWEAVYLARAGIPLARGWFRQDDFPQNAVLYRDPRRGGYLRWLRRLGVGYVVLTTAPTDYSARDEAALLRGGHSGLRPVFTSATTMIYAVPSPIGIVSGPGKPRVLALTSTGVSLALRRGGAFRLAIRYSPYWSARGVCLRKRADGMIELLAPRPGIVRLRFTITPARAVRALIGSSAECGQRH